MDVYTISATRLCPLCKQDTSFSVVPEFNQDTGRLTFNDEEVKLSPTHGALWQIMMDRWPYATSITDLFRVWGLLDVDLPANAAVNIYKMRKRLSPLDISIANSIGRNVEHEFSHYWPTWGEIKPDRCQICHQRAVSDIPVYDDLRRTLYFKGHSAQLTPIMGDIWNIMIRRWPRRINCQELYGLFQIREVNKHNNFQVQLFNLRKRVGHMGISIDNVDSRSRAHEYGGYRPDWGSNIEEVFPYDIGGLPERDSPVNNRNIRGSKAPS